MQIPSGFFNYYISNSYELYVALDKNYYKLNLDTKQFERTEISATYYNVEAGDMTKILNKYISYILNTIPEENLRDEKRIAISEKDTKSKDKILSYLAKLDNLNS